jgi:hypothetical protein
MARLREAQGDLDGALALLVQEFDHITPARVLLARYQSERADRSILEAMGLLERLLKAAEEGGRTGRVIEILVLQAIAYHAQGDYGQKGYDSELQNLKRPIHNRELSPGTLWHRAYVGKPKTHARSICIDHPGLRL